MAFRTVRYVRYLPLGDYRWMFRDADRKWHVREPPADWPLADYEAARLGTDATEPSVADNFFLMAPFSLDRATELIEEPNLYLRFASMRLTPATILDCANRLGPLDCWDIRGEFVPEEAQDVWREVFAADSDYSVHLVAEPAGHWLKLSGSLSRAISGWSELSTKPIKKKRAFLSNLNLEWKSELALHLEIDAQTGKAFTEIIASSLLDLIWTQWGLSVSADVHVKRCEKCEKLFVVHAGQG